MQKIVIFGAGQSGRMIGNLLHGSCELIAFVDNNYRNLPKYLDKVKVVSPIELMQLKVDKVIVSVLNKEAANEICVQLMNEGIKELDIIDINKLRDIFDVRLSTLRLLSKEINDNNVEGSIAELGVYRGYIAREINILFKKRKLYLFDTFEGFDEHDVDYENLYINSNIISGKFNDTSVEQVKSILQYPEQAIFCKGYFPNTAKEIEDKFAFVSIDADLYLPTYEGLKYFYPRLSKGGYILLHDYNSTQFIGVKKAVDDYAKEIDIRVVPMCDLHGSAVII